MPFGVRAREGGFHIIYPSRIETRLFDWLARSGCQVSTEARPLEIVLEEVRTEPAIPMIWGKNQDTAVEEITRMERHDALEAWNNVRLMTVREAGLMLSRGTTADGIIRELLRPFSWGHAIVTGDPAAASPSGPDQAGFDSDMRVMTGAFRPRHE